MAANGLTIGELARRGGVAATTLRYYEQIALLPPPVRVSGRRRYSEDVLRRLEVIRLCKAAGFTLEEIAVLFADETQGRPRSRALAQGKLAEIDARMAEWPGRATSSSGACPVPVPRSTPAPAASMTALRTGSAQNR